jgi:hypothetical protein
MQWTMVLPIAAVALAAVSCLTIRNKAGGQDRSAASAADSSQMAAPAASMVPILLPPFCRRDNYHDSQEVFGQITATSKTRL